MAETQALAVAEESTKKARYSRGDRLFDFLVYGPGNFSISFALSAILAVLQKRKAPFLHESVIDGLKSIHVPEKVAEAAGPVIFTSWGGTLALIPIKWAEDRRKAIVDRFNRWYGEKSAPNEVIKPEIKQSWASLIAGRLTVIGSVGAAMSVVGGMFHEQMAAAERSWGNWVATWFGTTSHKNLPQALVQQQTALEAQLKAGDKTVRKELSRVVRAIEKHETIPYTFGRMLAVDAIVTVVAVATLYVTSRFFAKSLNKKAEDVEPKVADIPSHRAHDADGAADKEPSREKRSFVARIADSSASADAAVAVRGA